MNAQDDVTGFSRRTQTLVSLAGMLAVFLGALDALIIGAAMPTIVAELGGLELYSWVFSAYMLTRAMALPVFGKLADLYSTKRLFAVAVALFLAGSVLAGLSRSMPQLILMRALQGVGAGANFALGYIVVAEVSAPSERGRRMGQISLVWGVASVLGPVIGGFIVNYWAWPWVFFLNVPVGCLAILFILKYFQESRQKAETPSIDYWGILLLSASVLAFLFAFLFWGKGRDWDCPLCLGLLCFSLLSGIVFWSVERRVPQPILPTAFFRVPGFVLANGAAFFSSFAIFSFLAFFPLFIQAVLGRTPAQMGLLMIPISVGWSAGGLAGGALVNRVGEKRLSIAGACLMVLGSGLILGLNESAAAFQYAAVAAGIGVGMGFVSVGTLLTAQGSLPQSDLGVATSSNQFARTLGGTVGVGISGGLAAHRIDTALQGLGQTTSGDIPAGLIQHLRENVQQLLRPESPDSIPEGAMEIFRGVIGSGIAAVFWAALTACVVTLVLCVFMRRLGR